MNFQTKFTKMSIHMTSKEKNFASSKVTYDNTGSVPFTYGQWRDFKG